MRLIEKTLINVCADSCLKPFVGKESFLHHYFLPSEYAIILPLVAAVLLITGVTVYLAISMIRKQKTQ